MPNNGVTNSVFIMQLTKEQLIDAHEQGLSISTRNGNIKIVAILNDVYGVNHFNSNKVNWWLFEQFERNEAKIEQPKPKINLSILKEGDIYVIQTKLHVYICKYINHNDQLLNFHSNYLLKNNSIEHFISGLEICVIQKINNPTESELELFYSKFPELKPKPKYNGRAVKCDTVEQLRYVATKHKSEYIEYADNNFFEKFNYYEYDTDRYRTEKECIKAELEIISFSDYCKENNIKEPKWIQGFEVGKDYNDVVMVSDDNYGWYSRILKSIANNRFIDNNGNAWIYARYPKRNEINEIKFAD